MSREFEVINTAAGLEAIAVRLVDELLVALSRVTVQHGHRLDDISGNVAALARGVENLDSRLGNLGDDGLALEDRLDDIDARLMAHDRRLEDLATHVGTLTATVDTAERRIAKLGSAVETLDGRVKDLDAARGVQEQRLEDLAAFGNAIVQELGTDPAGAATTVRDRLDHVDGRLQAIEGGPYAAWVEATAASAAQAAAPLGRRWTDAQGNERRDNPNDRPRPDVPAGPILAHSAEATGSVLDQTYLLTRREVQDIIAERIDQSAIATSPRLAQDEHRELVTAIMDALERADDRKRGIL